ncbi:melatonin receptor type 1B-B-like [Glandiceps talaboti]
MNSTNATVKLPTPTIRMTPEWATLFSASLETIICTGGLIGNILFIAAVMTKKKLRTYSNIFLVNLSITDLIAILFVCIPSTDSYFNRGWRFGRNYGILHNYLHPTLLSISLWLTMFVAVNRYVYIVHNSKYGTVTNRLTVTLALVLAWLVPAAVVLDNFVQKPSSQYVPLAFRYTSTFTKTRSVIFVCTLFYVPSAVAILCYFFIFIYVRKTRMRMKAHNENNPTTSANNHGGPSAQEVRMVVVTLAVFVLVMFGYLPFVILLFVCKAMGKPIPIGSMVLIYPLIHVCGLVNPILYGITNRHVRAAYKAVIVWKLPCRRTTNMKVTPIVTVSEGATVSGPGSTARTLTTSSSSTTTTVKADV